MRLFDFRGVLALDVLDDRQRLGFRVCGLSHDNGHVVVIAVQVMRSDTSAFTGDQLVVAWTSGMLPDDHGFDDTARRFDGFRHLQLALFGDSVPIVVASDDEAEFGGGLLHVTHVL